MQSVGCTPPFTLGSMTETTVQAGNTDFQDTDGHQRRRRSLTGTRTCSVPGSSVAVPTGSGRPRWSPTSGPSGSHSPDRRSGGGRWALWAERNAACSLRASTALLVLFGPHFGLYRLPERTTDWSFADDLSAAFVTCSIWGWFWLLGMGAIDVAPVLSSIALWGSRSFWSRSPGPWSVTISSRPSGTGSR